MTEHYYSYQDLDGFTWPAYEAFSEWAKQPWGKSNQKQPFVDKWLKDYPDRESMLLRAPAADPAPTIAGIHAAAVGGTPDAQAAAMARLGAYTPEPILHSRDPALQPGRVETMIAERKQQHGDFNDHAEYTQALKRVMIKAMQSRNARNQAPLSDTQREGLEMVLHKVGRILAGDANHADHWDDIAGYATITRERN